MGICASCLGLNRHPSQDIDETDALLDDEHAEYGGVGAGEGAQMDEEELRREREALDRITNEATGNMIDVSNSEAVEWNRRSDERPPYPGQTQDPAQDEGEDDIDEEEAMWLRSLQEEDLTTVKGVQSGAGLVMDPGDLRQTSNRSRKG